MTDRIALWIAVALALVVIGDLMIYGDQHMIFLGKKFAEFLEWIAFWR